VYKKNSVIALLDTQLLQKLEDNFEAETIVRGVKPVTDGCGQHSRDRIILHGNAYVVAARGRVLRRRSLLIFQK